MTSVIFFSLIFIVLLAVPRILRLRIALWSSIFQFYTLPLLGFYPSIALLGHFSLAPSIPPLKRYLRHPALMSFMALLCIQTISLLWSPNKMMGVSTLLYELPFLILYLVSVNLAAEHRNSLAMLIKMYAGLSLLPFLILFLFRFHFDLDADYIQTTFASYLINPNTIKNSPYAGHHIELIALAQKYAQTPFMTGRWLDKPHSVFMNPNTCAGYMGICALLFYGAGVYFQSRFLKCAALAQWLGLFLILSFSAMFFAAVIPFFLVLIYFFYKNHRVLGLTSKQFMMLGSCLLLLSIAGMLLHPGLNSIISHKLEARLELWKAALSFVPGHAFTGLGFGGWGIAYQQYVQAAMNPALQATYPPHNTFIQLFFESGPIAVIFCLSFMYFILKAIWQAFRSLLTSREKILALCVFGAFLWVFLQGMGENWGFLGDIHVQPILAVLFGLLMSLTRKDNHV